MKLLCMLLGCDWHPPVTIELGGEQFTLLSCRRCPAHRYWAQKSPREAG